MQYLGLVWNGHPKNKASLTFCLQKSQSVKKLGWAIGFIRRNRPQELEGVFEGCCRTNKKTAFMGAAFEEGWEVLNLGLPGAKPVGTCIHVIKNIV